MVIDAGPVTLRPWEGDDVAFVFDSCQDPEIARWADLPRPFTAGDAAAFVRAAQDDLDARSRFAFAIVLTDTGELVGSIALHHVADGAGEISYWMAAEGRGRGLATQALDALAAWSLDRLALLEVRVRIAVGNEASLRVATKASFVEAEVRAAECHDGGAPADAIVLVRRAG